MANKTDMKYLKKQRNIWFYARVLPKKYRPYFINKKTGQPITTFKKTTECELLDDAIFERDIINIKLNVLFKEIDNNSSNIISGKAQTNLQKLIEYRKVQVSSLSSDSSRDGAGEMVSNTYDEIIEKAQDLFIPQVSTKEFERVSATKHGWDKERGIIKLDKSGKAKQFLDESLGRTFNSYVDEYIKHKTLWGDSEKKTRAYRLIINTFSKTMTLDKLNKKAVKQWAINRVIEQGYQPDTVITEAQFLNKYLEYLADELEIKWANIKSPFKLKTEHFPAYKKNKSAKDRQAWSMEDMKLVYQADTPQVINKPELKNLIALGMIYGCRIEEFLQLTIANIVYEENIRCIYIDKSKTDGYHPFGQRYLPIVDCLNPIIERMIEDKQQEDYLITTASSPKQSRSALIGGSFIRHIKELGYERPKNLNFGGKPQQAKDFHSYRKTVNTNLLGLGLITSQRNSICGWGTAFNNKQMAETAYLQNKMAYPLVQRKEHLELWASQFTFSF